MTENCYFCHLLKVLSVQACKCTSLQEEEEWRKKETEKADGKSVTFVTFLELLYTLTLVYRFLLFISEKYLKLYLLTLFIPIFVYTINTI
jgi:hypothetical protein